MKKFVVIYHASQEAMAKMGESTPEEMKEGMKPWMEWAERCGDGLVDLGAPLMGGQKVTPSGSQDVGGTVSGYSILQAESMEDAKKLLENHPHLGWDASCEIAIYEAMPLEVEA